VTALAAADGAASSSRRHTPSATDFSVTYLRASAAHVPSRMRPALRDSAAPRTLTRLGHRRAEQTSNTPAGSALPTSSTIGVPDNRPKGDATVVTEAEWENIALDVLFEHGWETLSGSETIPGKENGRTSWADIVLPARLLAAIRNLNPLIPGQYLEQALATILQPTSQDAVAENFRLEVVPGLVELEVAVPRSAPTVR
jgi:hypothetical protein